jgi:hypothetical protein
MHDGATAHFSLVRDVMNNTYHRRWTGGGGPAAWPPRSPDLNPMDFHLWGHLNTLMYAALVDSEETLPRIVDVFLIIRSYPGILAVP